MTRICRIVMVAAAIFLTAEATLVGASVKEAFHNRRCTANTGKGLPKKMTIFQVISDDAFSAPNTATIFVESTYLFRGDVDPGKIIAKGTLIKSDGSQILLPKLAKKLQFCCASKSKETNLSLEPGDMIEWNIRIKGHSPLEEFDCWDMAVGVWVDDD